jgi:hypothetical protein
LIDSCSGPIEQGIKCRRSICKPFPNPACDQSLKTHSRNALTRNAILRATCDKGSRDVIGEWIGSEQGLGGYMIIQASAQIMTTRVFSAIALLAVMGIALFLIASAIERVVIPWQRRG